MIEIALVGLLKIELPDHSILLCDGGALEFAGEMYRSDDPLFGTIGAVEAMDEGVGDTVPSFSLTMLPAQDTPPGMLSRPGYQTSRVRFWIAEYDVDAGTVIKADPMFDGQIDQSTLSVGRGARYLNLTVVGLAERLFEGNIGNTLNPTWHKSIWPGERGHDNATGLARSVAWGIEGPPQGGGGRGGGNVREAAQAFRRQVF